MSPADGGLLDYLRTAFDQLFRDDDATLAELRRRHARRMIDKLERRVGAINRRTALRDLMKPDRRNVVPGAFAWRDRDVRGRLPD